MSNIELCRKLFKIMEDGIKSASEESLFKVQTIEDYFTLRTLFMIEFYDVKTAEKYSTLFREFEEKAVTHKFFFHALGNMLDCKQVYLINNSSERIDCIRQLVKGLNEVKL